MRDHRLNLRSAGSSWVKGTSAAVGAMACALTVTTTMALGSASAATGYEQVTPPNKNGGAVSGLDTFRSTADGMGLLYTVTGSMDGAPSESVPLYARYFGRRSADGWINQAVDPPFVDRDPPYPGTAQYIQAVIGSSADLSHVLVATRAVLAPGAIEGGGSWYMRNTATGSYRLVATSADPAFATWAQSFGGNDNVVYVAEDGQGAQFISAYPILSGFTPGPYEDYLYSWTADEGLELDSVLPAESGGAPAIVYGAAGSGSDGPRNPMPLGSDGLDRVYFADGNTGRLYVRRGHGSNRVSSLVSFTRVDPEVQDPSAAAPVSVSAGGRFLLFQTTDSVRLTANTPTDLPGGAQWLYRYDEVDESLEYVGAVPNNQRVIQMAQDGKTVAFYSTIEQAGSTADAEQKLFVWRESTGLKYVYTSDFDGVAGPWTSPQQLRRLSDNGKFVAFSETAPSLAASFGYDAVDPQCNVPQSPSDNCDQVYRYDVSADKLECVSCDERRSVLAYRSGDPGMGSPGITGLSRYQVRTIADDGTAFFTSTGDLVPEDVNGQPDAYARGLDGRLRLISTGRSATSGRFLDASADGSSAFVATNERLAQSDTDDRVDIYRVGEGAGFVEEPPRIVPPCAGADCRDLFVDPPLVAGPGTADTDKQSASASSTARRRASVRVLWARVSKNRLQVRVRPSSGGRVRVSGEFFRPTSRDVPSRGAYTLSLRMTAKGQDRLRKRGRLAVRLRASLSPPFGLSAHSTYRRTMEK